MHDAKTVHLLGYATGLAGADPRSSEGPKVLQQSPYFQALSTEIDLIWDGMIESPSDKNISKLELITTCVQKLANKTYDYTKAKKFFTVLGGDHSSAIGTWSGVSNALSGPLGLIWIDAHMDSHTPHTSLTGNIHGMPLACLLGYGTSSLTTIMNNRPKVKPENICLIGVRSFERGEAALLKELNVKIFFMEEIRQRGLQAVMQDALKIVKKDTAGYGISLDIDGIDPSEAPGTGSPVPNGLNANDLCQALHQIENDPQFLGMEIVEFDPSKDKDHKTEKLIPELFASMILAKKKANTAKHCLHLDPVSV